MPLKPSEISIVIADDHPMLLKGLYDELTKHNYNVVSQALQGMQALEAVLSERPDVALLDIDMPLLTGFDVVKMAKEKGVLTKFIVLSFHKESEYVAQAKSLQIEGYLLKEDSFFEIERCIQTVLSGKTCFSKSFDTKAIIDAEDELGKLKLLTPSETLILKKIANQNSTNAIAKQLSVSSRTIEKHRSNIIEKLGLKQVNTKLSNWAMTNKVIILAL